jgi:hypothetical protein
MTILIIPLHPLAERREECSATAEIGVQGADPRVDYVDVDTGALGGGEGVREGGVFRVEVRCDLKGAGEERREPP